MWWKKRTLCQARHAVSRAPIHPNPRTGVPADLLRPISAGLQIFAESLEVLFPVIVEHRDRHVIHSGSAFVGGDLRERRNQCAFGVDLVDQAELLASFDPEFEGRQHPLCPNRRFDPAPAEQDLSGTCSPRGHCLWSFFRRFGHRVSAFLYPFAPPALPGFFATMGALTPGRPALRLTREHEHRLWRHPGLPTFCHRVVRSFRLQPPTAVPTCFWVFLGRAYRTTLPWSPLRGHASFGLRHDGRPNRFHLRYGLIVHLRLFPTPPRGNAVSVGFGVPKHPGKGFHPADSMQLQVHQGWVQPNGLKSMSAGELGFAPRTLRRAASPVLGRCPRASVG